MIRLNSVSLRRLFNFAADIVFVRVMIPAQWMRTRVLRMALVMVIGCLGAFSVSLYSGWELKW